MSDFLNEIYEKIMNIWKNFTGTDTENNEPKKEYKYNENFYETVSEDSADSYINYYDFNDEESFKD